MRTGLERLTHGIERTSEAAALVSPGNFSGGVSSVSEKALGGIHKSGSSKFVGVLNYAERPWKNGLFLMKAASSDCDVVTSLAAGRGADCLFCDRSRYAHRLPGRAGS